MGGLLDCVFPSFYFGLSLSSPCSFGGGLAMTNRDSPDNEYYCEPRGWVFLLVLVTYLIRWVLYHLHDYYIGWCNDG